MNTHELQQGSAAWHSHRASHFNASEAPAMLGCSLYTTRSQLLQQMHTGIAPEVDAATQRRFDEGHRYEAMARPIAEEIIGEDLYPVTGSEGELSASFDGLTIAQNIAFEHKSLNDGIRASLPHQGRDSHQHNDGARLEKLYRVQMEQQLLVSGAERVLFSATSWQGADLIEERHCWYESDPALRAEIVAGWEQFAADLAAFVPTAAADPVPTGRAPETLPALHIEVTGMVTASNLEAFKANALAVFASINRTLTTDGDFADAEKTVKWCGEVEDRLKAAKEHALSQTQSIDALFRTIDAIGAEARTVRLELDKLVKARKESIRVEILQAAIAEFNAHLSALNTRLGRPYMPSILADFGGAMKGKKTVASLKDAVAVEMARAKIAANAQADQIDLNLKAMAAAADDAHFHDAATLVLKQPDDLQAIIAQRVAATRQARDEQRERIRAEEQAKAEKAAREKLDAEQRAAATPAPTAAPAQPLVAAPIAPPALSSPAANVVPLGTRAPAVESTARIALGKINERLAPVQITAAGLAALGFEPVATDKASKLYRDADFKRICGALVTHIQAAQLQRQAA